MRKAPHMDDELLLYELGRALEQTRFVPPEDRVMELRAMVCVRYPEAAAATGSPGPVRVPRLRSALVSAALGITMAGGGAAFAAGATLPGPLRAVAARVGLPVDPPAVAAARSAEGDLREQLRQVASRPEANHTQAVTKAAVVLVNRVAQLSPAQREALGTAPAELLGLAHTYTPLAPAAPATIAARPATTPPQMLAAPAAAVNSHTSATASSNPLGTQTLGTHVNTGIYLAAPASAAPVVSQRSVLKARRTISLPTTVMRTVVRTQVPVAHHSTSPNRTDSSRLPGAVLPAMMSTAQR